MYDAGRLYALLRFRSGSLETVPAVCYHTAHDMYEYCLENHGDMSDQKYVEILEANGKME